MDTATGSAGMIMLRIDVDRWNDAIAELGRLQKEYLRAHYAILKKWQSAVDERSVGWPDARRRHQARAVCRNILGNIMTTRMTLLGLARGTLRTPEMPRKGHP